MSVSGFRAAIIAAVILNPLAFAAHLGPRTLAAWDEQLQKVRLELEHEAASPQSFLSGPMPGYLIESPEPSGCPIPDYDHYTQIFPPAVVESRLVSRDGAVFNYHVKFIQKELGSKSGLLADFQSRYFRLDSRSGYIVTESVKLTELQNPGRPDERPLAFANAKGFIERSYSVMLYRETDYGVIIRIESLTLSRDVPNSIRWLVAPFIRHFARQTTAATLNRIRDCVSMN